MNKAKKIDVESKTFVAPTPNLELSATDNLYIAVTARVSAKKTFVYTLVSPRTPTGHYPIFPEIKVAAFKDPDKADIYKKTIVDIMRWQSTSYLQKIRQYFRENAADFYKQKR